MAKAARAAGLDAASAPTPRFPYTFFTPGMQAMLTGGTTISDKPPGYQAPVLIDAKPAGVTNE